MHFLRTPAEVLPSEADPGRAGAVKLERNALQPKPDGSQRAVGTGEFEIQSVKTLPSFRYMLNLNYIKHPASAKIM